MNRRRLAGLGAISLTVLAFAWINSATVVYLPLVALAPTPTPSPLPTVTPTRPPPLSCAPSTGQTSTFYSSRGVQASQFKLQSTCVQPGADVWFDFTVTNSGSLQYVGGLGAIWCTDRPGQCTQASWGDFWFSNLVGGNPQDPNNVIAWPDHLNTSTSGYYQVRLGICWLANRDTCEKNPGSWEYLSGPITLTIQ